MEEAAFLRPLAPSGTVPTREPNGGACMNSHQIERAAYMAAHALLTANISAPELACPGARRSHAVDTIAGIIKNVFELHCEELNAFTDWWEDPIVIRNPHPPLATQPARWEKILPIRAETAVEADR